MFQVEGRARVKVSWCEDCGFTEERRGCRRGWKAGKGGGHIEIYEAG